MSDSSDATAVELAHAIGQLSHAIEQLESKRSTYPTWWQTWFSPATIVLAFTAMGVVWATSSRMATQELSINNVATNQGVLAQRISALESAAVTKEWLSREVGYQRDMYAPKASVDVMVQRLEEFQRQLNVIEGIVRSNKR